MKKQFLFLCFVVASFSGMAQTDFEENESFLIGRLEIRPSLSVLEPLMPSSNLTLREVDFSRKKEKPKVNMIAMMEQVKNRKSRTVDIESPFLSPKEDEESLFKLSDDIRIYGRGSNYDPYTGKTRNAAEREARAGMFRGYNNPFLGRSYRSPYHYNPYLR